MGIMWIRNLEKLAINCMPEYLETTVGDQEFSDHQSVVDKIKSESLKINDEHIIRLLEERLVIDNHKQKIGEVVVRKLIETRIVEVPVRREKLIVEQVSPKYQQLAEIDLGEEKIIGVELKAPGWDSADFNGGLTVNGEFNSPKIASLLLNAIALEANPGCHQVKVTILVEDESHQKKYQEWFARCV